jgi:hypothetical protein
VETDNSAFRLDEYAKCEKNAMDIVREGGPGSGALSKQGVREQCKEYWSYTGTD